MTTAHPPLGLRGTSARGSGALRGAVASWVVARWPLLAGTALVGVLLDLLLGGPLTTGADVAVNRWMAALPHTGPDLALALVLDNTGKITVVTPVLLVAAGLACWRERSWRSLGLVAGTLFTLLAVLAVVKFGLARGLAVNGDPSLLVPGGQAFPSGHAAQAAVAAGLLIALLPRVTGRPVRRSTALLVVAVPCSVMTSVSLYLGFHWLSDLVAGTLAGLLAARAGLVLERRRAARRAAHRIGVPPLHLVTAVRTDLRPAPRADDFDVDLPERERVPIVAGS